MRFLAAILLTISLAVGAIAGATAYLVPLDAPDNHLLNRELGADAGVVVSADGASVTPLVTLPEGDDAPALKIDADILQRLRDNAREVREAGVKIRGRGISVNRVRVKDFRFGTWRERWWFVGAVAGMIVAATLNKIGAKRTRERLAAEAAAGVGAAGKGPEAALADMRETVRALRRDLPSMPDDKMRNDAVIDRIGRLQKTSIPAFAEGRDSLIARLGLSGYALLMDRFAASERMLNRAWSAAADDFHLESSRCIERAEILLAETEERLKG